VLDVTEKLAGVPLKVTDETAVNRVPLIVTAVPTGPLVGVKPVIVGGFTTVKLAVLVAVPAGFVTVTGPLVAPLGTVAWITVAEVTVKPAAVPLNFTAVVPVKFEPLIVTLVPTTPLAGEKVVIIGGTVTVKLFALVAVPSGVVTTIGPEEAPAGTVA